MKQRYVGCGHELVAFAAPIIQFGKWLTSGMTGENHKEKKPVAPGSGKALGQLITMGFTNLERTIRRAHGSFTSQNKQKII